MLSKERLIFDASAVSDSDLVGAYIQDSDTSYTISGITSQVSDKGNLIIARRNDAGGALSADGDYIPLTTDSSGSLRVSVGSSGTSVVTGNVADSSADSGNPIKIGARAVVGAGLVETGIADNDRTDAISDSYRRLWVNNSCDIGVANAAITISGVAIALVSSALSGRNRILIQNISNGASNSLYVGGAGVTTGNGIRISAGAALSFEVGEHISLLGISGGTASVRILELA